MTKADQIRALLAKGWPTGRIAKHLKLDDPKYVCRIRWCGARPEYHRDSMRKTRSDPAYRDKEYDQQAIYRREKRRASV